MNLVGNSRINLHYHSFGKIKCIGAELSAHIWESLSAFIAVLVKLKRPVMTKTHTGLLTT